MRRVRKVAHIVCVIFFTAGDWVNERSGPNNRHYPAYRNDIVSLMKRTVLAGTVGVELAVEGGWRSSMRQQARPIPDNGNTVNFSKLRIIVGCREMLSTAVVPKSECQWLPLHTQLKLRSRHQFGNPSHYRLTFFSVDIRNMGGKTRVDENTSLACLGMGAQHRMLERWILVHHRSHKSTVVGVLITASESLYAVYGAQSLKTSSFGICERLVDGVHRDPEGVPTAGRQDLGVQGRAERWRPLPGHIGVPYVVLRRVGLVIQHQRDLRFIRV